MTQQRLLQEHLVRFLGIVAQPHDVKLNGTTTVGSIAARRSAHAHMLVTRVQKGLSQAGMCRKSLGLVLIASKVESFSMQACCEYSRRPQQLHLEALSTAKVLAKCN